MYTISEERSKITFPYTGRLLKNEEESKTTGYRTVEQLNATGSSSAHIIGNCGA